jgi:hypothetical protein
MKLNGKILMAVAMMVGSLGAMGCNPLNDQGNAAVAPEETPATAPVEKDGVGQANKSPGVEQNAYWYRGYAGPRYYAPHAPPAVRYEYQGRAPSSRHFWAPGYYRWNGREHVWIGGRWDVRRDGYEYVSPHWENRYGRWEYIPGHWARRW